MAAILKLRRGTSASPSLVDGELFLNYTTGTIQFASGSEVSNLLPLNKTISGNIVLTGDISASNLLLTGDLVARDINARNVVLSGDIFLGDGNQSTDNIYVNASFSGSLLPDTTNVYNLGNENYRYKELHVSSSFIDVATIQSINLPNSRILSSSLGTYQDFDTFSGSVDTRFEILNSYTQSNDQRVNSIETFTQSVDLRVSDLETTSLSHDLRIDDLEITGSDHETRITSIEGYSSSLDSRLDNLEFTGSNHETRVSILESSQSYFDNTYSSSVDSKIESLNSYTQSTDQRLGSIETFTQSADLRVTNLESSQSLFDNTFSGSVDLRLDNAELTGSDHETRITSIEGYSSSLDSRLDDLESTGSNHESRLDTIETTFSSSVDSRLDNLNLYTQSNDTRIDGIDLFTSSQETKNTTLETYTSSVEQRIGEIHSYTSSLKTAIDTSGNDLIVLGNLTVQGTQTSLNTSQTYIEDLAITLASGALDGASANGAGIEIAGANQSLTWDNPNSQWAFTSQVSASSFVGDGSGIENVTAANVEYSNVLNKPTLVSGSSQISFNGITDKPSLVSGSSQIDLTLTTNYESGIKDRLNVEDVISSSVQVDADTITNFDQNVRDVLVQDVVHSGSYLGTATTSDLDEGLNLYYTLGRFLTASYQQGFVSGSSQIDLTQTSNYISGIKDRLNSETVVSGSSQIDLTQTSNYISGIKNRLNSEFVVSGSSGDQLTSSLDTRYVNESNFAAESSSFDSRLDTLEISFSSSVDSRLDSLETDQHTHSNKLNLDTINQDLSTTDSPTFNSVTLSNLSFEPTSSTLLQGVLYSSSGELVYSSFGDAVYYNVSQSIANGDPNTLGNAKAVKDYIDDQLLIIGAGDITSVLAGDGMSGGGLSGSVTLTLNTGSTHFTNGVNTAITSYSSSVDSRLINLELFSSSLDQDFVTQQELAFATSSLQNSIDTKLDSSSFNSYTQSNDLRVNNLESTGSDHETRINSLEIAIGEGASIDTRLDNLEVFTSSIDTTIKTKLNTDGVISGSSQLTTEFDLRYLNTNGDSIVSSSAQISLFNTFLEINGDSVVSSSQQISSYGVFAELNGDNLVSSSQQISNYNTFLEINGDSIVSSSAQISAYNTFLEINGDGVVSGSDQLTGSLVDLTSAQTISGTKTFQDIIVNGTGSFSYIVSTTGSAKLIGDAYIVLNNNTPTERYAGIKVFDSGSAGTTASLEYDGQSNDWFYQYTDDGGVTDDFGVVLFGPEYSSKGIPTYPSNNTIQKGNGGHHLLDSNITDNGTLITLDSNVQVNGDISITGTVDGIDLQNFSSSVDGRLDTLEGETHENPLTFSDTTTIDFSRVGDTITANAIGGIISGSTFSSPSQGTLDAVINGNTQSIDLGLQTTDTVQFGKVGVGGASDVTYELKVTGDIGATGDVVAYVSSDRRLKDEITPIENSLQKINSIGGYSFVWNENQHIYKGKDYGVIAQEIEEVLPELVETRDNGYKAVKYDRIVSLLIEGIKELTQEVAELKNKLEK